MTLCEVLASENTAPSSGFDKFVVGQQRHVLNSLKQELTEFVSGQRTASISHLLLGANGTGKTLIHEALAAEATEVNLRERPHDNVFSILYATADLSNEAHRFWEQLGAQLSMATSLGPERSYAAISSRLTLKFYNEYSFPWWTSAALFFPKWGISRITREIKEGFGDESDFEAFLTDAGAATLKKSIDNGFLQLQKRMSQAETRQCFEAFARDKGMWNVLTEQFSAGKGVLTAGELSDKVEQDFKGKSATRAIQEICNLAKAVECKVVILMLDECNPAKPPHFLLPVLNQFERFGLPIMLIVNGIKDVWDGYNLAHLRDRSLYEKIGSREQELPSPSQDTLADLHKRLIRLFEDEYNVECDLADLALEDVVDEVLAARLSFRLATRQFLPLLSEKFPHLQLTF